MNGGLSDMVKGTMAGALLAWVVALVIVGYAAYNYKKRLDE